MTSKRSRVAVSLSFQAVCTDSSNRCNAYSGDAPFIHPILPFGRSSNVSAAHLKRLTAIVLRVFSMVFRNSIGRYPLEMW